MAGYVEVLVLGIANSNCTNLSDAAQKFQTRSIDFEERAKAFQRFVDASPVKIRGDLQTFADAYSKWAEAMKRFDALKDADFTNPSRETLQTLDDVTVEVDRNEMQQASKNVVAWMDENCG